MKNDLSRYMPADQIRLCNTRKQCIEARGENAKIIVYAVAFLLLASAAYTISRIK
jgi:hypothetical protein